MEPNEEEAHTYHHLVVDLHYLVPRKDPAAAVLSRGLDGSNTCNKQTNKQGQDLLCWKGEGGNLDTLTLRQIQVSSFLGQ